jgi:hypothetical protein
VCFSNRHKTLLKEALSGVLGQGNAIVAAVFKSKSAEKQNKYRKFEILLSSNLQFFQDELHLPQR